MNGGLSAASVVGRHMDCEVKIVDQRRIVVILPTVLPDDAVGNATRSLIDDLSGIDGAQVTLVARSNDRLDMPFVAVRSLGELLLVPEFLEANIIIYVFAIFSDLFDAMLIGNGHAAQVVRFHNVTPKAFVVESAQQAIEQSINQIQNFKDADEIWADSRENIEELIRHGIDEGVIKNMPLTVELQAKSRLVAKPVDIIRFVYVGRFVPSKGLEDLIEAFDLVKAQAGFPFQARLMGSTRHSSKTYLEVLKTLISDRGLRDIVLMDGAVSQTELSDAYCKAHVVTTASRHEGFCVPIIEGLSAGCVPVTYANSNLKNISGGLGRLAEHDTPFSLAQALMDIGGGLHRASDVLRLESGAVRLEDFDAAAATYVQFFSREVCADRIVNSVERLLGQASDLNPVFHPATTRVQG